MKKIGLIIVAIMLTVFATILVACNNAGNDGEITDDGLIKPDEPINYSEGLGYSVNTGGETCTITGTGTCIDSKISIPEEIDGYKVTAIAPYAFYNNSGIITVFIPEGVTSIGDKAFYNCSGLKSISIPDSVITIGEEAFSGCLNIVEATISIIAVKHIPKDNLKTVVITSGTTIGEYAFYGCRKLTSIVIPDSVTTIGEGAFLDCTNIIEVTMPTTAIDYIPQNSLKTVVINGGTNIGAAAFSGCDSLTSIVIPDSVTTIDEYAFQHCSSLTSIVIPDSVTTIEREAFSNCSSLISVTIGDNVTTIGQMAFAFCDCLVEVYNYSSLNITKGGRDYGYVGFYALDIYTTNDPSKLTNNGGLIIHSNGTLVKYIGTATEIIIPAGVTCVRNFAFSRCSSLTNITIPTSVITIGEYSFFLCESLISATFEDSNGWYVTMTEGASSGTTLQLTNTSTNATYLNETYYSYYWYKKTI